MQPKSLSLANDIYTMNSLASIVPYCHQDVKPCIADELSHWTNEATQEEERQGRVKASDQIYACSIDSSIELDLSYYGLTTVPNCLGSLTTLQHLNLSGNALLTFPFEQILQLNQLQDIQLSMNEYTGSPIKCSHEILAKKGYTMTFFAQGNVNTKVLSSFPSEPNALYTTDLDPCLAVMIIQENTILCVHVDSFGKSGIGGISLDTILYRHLVPNKKATRVFLVGANSQGSAGNLRGVLYALQKLELHSCIKMASLGNGHTSATLDLDNKVVYVGKG